MPANPYQSNRKIWAIIPAAGSGSRFSKSELKQYQMIQNQTVLQHTVERLNALPLSGYVLAIGEQDTFAPTLEFKNKHLCHFSTPFLKHFSIRRMSKFVVFALATIDHGSLFLKYPAHFQHALVYLALE